MGILLLILSFLCLAQRSAPTYSTATIVNSATNLPILSPGVMASVYGKDLATGTRDLQPSDVGAEGLLPISFPFTGVSVVVHGLPAPLLSVSPEKVTFIIPFEIPSGEEISVLLLVNGAAGPRLTLHMYAESPGLFLLEPGVASAAHKDGTPVTAENPAVAGEGITLYATGLGPAAPAMEYRQAAPERASLLRLEELRVLLDGRDAPTGSIRSAGPVAGMAGMFRVEFALPENCPTNPEVRIGFGDALSPEGVQLRVK